MVDGNSNQGAGIEWETLNQEAMDLRRAGKYDRAVVVAQKALQVAEENVGPDHPDVDLSLENLAALYRVTQRNKEAEALEMRAARIRAIRR
jgi:tetratricopeptide (TPR) repeat protein